MTAQRITRGPFAEYPPDEQARIIATAKRFNATTTCGDETFITAASLSMVFDGSDVTKFTNPDDPWMSRRKCEHCGRSDIVEKIAYGLDEAVEFGWLIPVAEVDA